MKKVVACIVASVALFGSAVLAAAADSEHKHEDRGGKGGRDRPSSRPAPQVHRGGPEVRQHASPRPASPPAASVHNQLRQRRDAGTRRFDRPAARPRAAEHRDGVAAQKRTERKSAKQGERAAERERQNERNRAAERENERKRAAERERAADQDRKLQAGKKLDEPPVAQKRDNSRVAGHEELRRKRLDLSVDQRSRLRTAFHVDRDRGRASNVRFARRVGAHIPRGVRLFAIPAAVFAFFPDYRSYSYVEVDDTICIVDPATYEIVDVLDEDYFAPPRDTPEVAQLSLTAAESALVLDSIAPDFPEADVRLRLALGADIPDRVELHEFAPIVLDRVTKLRNFRFIVAQGSVVIVDPRDRTIEFVLER